MAAHLAPQERRATGAYFTPAEIVDRVLDAVSPYVPANDVAFIDPSCGGGAFLARVAQRFPRASLYGMELNAQSLKIARSRVPRATLLEGDALEPQALPRLLRSCRAPCEIWVGNPPYNGTSEQLRDKSRWAELTAGLPQLRGQSLREDYAFFLLAAVRRLRERRGVLAFITSASLLDSWAHAPLRKFLCDNLALHQVQPLEKGTFRNTRVRTCFTVFTTPDLGPGFAVAPPEFLFEPKDPRALELDGAGTRLSRLVPLSFAGLKTRFDELLVDDDRERLVERLKRFCAGRPVDVPDRCRAKLKALPRPEFDERAVRRFLHPTGRRAWCYVDRRLIPRGDHRFQGQWDPHSCPVKLVFNHREWPLHAQVLDEEGCVTAYRHTRFAPLWVPQRILAEGVGVAKEQGPWGRLVPNLTAPCADPKAAFEAIAAHINSPSIQKVWGPAFATTRDIPIQM